MKIERHKNFYVDVDKYVLSEIREFMYGGAIERTEHVADETAAIVARLLDALASKGLLTAPELHHIVEGYKDADARFEDATRLTPA